MADESSLTPMAKFVSLVGVPSAIALFLVWFGANGTSNNIEAAKKAAETSNELIKTHMQIMQEHINFDRDQSLRLERYLRIICINIAKTQQDTSNCLQVQ